MHTLKVHKTSITPEGRYLRPMYEDLAYTYKVKMSLRKASENILTNWTRYLRRSIDLALYEYIEDIEGQGDVPGTNQMYEPRPNTLTPPSRSSISTSPYKELLSNEDLKTKIPPRLIGINPVRGVYMPRLMGISLG